MSEGYIKKHFADIKKYANTVEKRLNDEWCTMDSVLADNARFLKLARKYRADYVLIDDAYVIPVDL